MGVMGATRAKASHDSGASRQDRSGSTTSNGSSGSGGNGGSGSCGGSLKRTCSSYSLLSELRAAAAAADGALDLCEEDEVEPPDADAHPHTTHHHFTLYARDDLRMSSSAPSIIVGGSGGSGSSKSSEKKRRKSLLSKLRRRSSTSLPTPHSSSAASLRDKHLALPPSVTSPHDGASRSSSPMPPGGDLGMHRAWSMQQFFDHSPKNGGKHAKQPLAVGRASVTRGASRSHGKNPFSRVRSLLKKKNRLDNGRLTRAASDLSSSASSSEASFSGEMKLAHDPNSHHPDGHSHHSFSHTCTHCGRTHTLHATLTPPAHDVLGPGAGSGGVASSSNSASRSASPSLTTTSTSSSSSSSAEKAAAAAASAAASSNGEVGEQNHEAGAASVNPDESDLLAIATDDPLSTTTQYCCKNSAADSDLFPIMEGKLMLTRNPSDAFPSSYKLRLRCTHFEESLLHQWFEIDHYDPNQQENDAPIGIGAHAHAHHHSASAHAHGHPEICPYCSLECALCAHDLSSTHSSSSGGSGGSAPVGIGGYGAPLTAFTARPDYVYTLDENFSFERPRATA